MKITVTSTAFTEGGFIPKQYTCDGKNISPAIMWKNIPPVAKSIALISDDPDAPVGTWVHWVVYNIPVNLTGLAEDLPKNPILPNGIRQGTTDFRKIGYGGPCPPGGTHRYFFKVYALSSMLEIQAGATKAQLLESMKGKILAEGALIGKYKR